MPTVLLDHGASAQVPAAHNTIQAGGEHQGLSGVPGQASDDLQPWCVDVTGSQGKSYGMMINPDV